ncbi:MAG: tRNA (adenosine(37)-N6)-threonylcarbamoyltransferase complex ATPase subunit type 1 TsaE [Chitinivibrionales bacterium]|nr:tRNA (adenosine(37)-N6)-threonylcarbamoyltransferase complex ATPase subunit type 1 TsaE [Chitinivibrionales bacterium]
MRVTSNSVLQTRCYGAQCAEAARPGAVYALIGALGCGKTEFARGFVAALNPQAPVRSPSFALIYVYETARAPVCHADFYRLNNARELAEIGFEDYLRGEYICLIEWADLFPQTLPRDTIKIYFTDAGAGSRSIESDFSFFQL